MCMPLLGQSQSVAVCPTTPDRAVFTSRLSLWFECSAFILRVHLWDTLSDSLYSFQIADELISSPSMGYSFLVHPMMDAACALVSFCVFVISA